MSTPVDMNEVISRSQALTVDSLGKAFGAQMTRLQMIGDKKFDEVDTAQAWAERYLTTGQPNDQSARTA